MIYRSKPEVSGNLKSTYEMSLIKQSIESAIHGTVSYSEICISLLILFCRLRALTTKYNSSPHEASRPFDCDRDGFV